MKRQKFPDDDLDDRPEKRRLTSFNPQHHPSRQANNPHGTIYVPHNCNPVIPMLEPYGGNRQQEPAPRSRKKKRKRPTCEWCFKSFGNNKTLRRHLYRNHEAKLPYECDLCISRWPDADALENHRRKKHEIYACNYECDGICNVDELSFIQHMTTVHGEMVSFRGQLLSDSQLQNQPLFQKNLAWWLKKLDFSWNKITKIPKELFTSGFNYLKTLNLSHNKGIKRLPLTELNKLPALEDLFVNNTNFQVHPLDIVGVTETKFRVHMENTPAITKEDLTLAKNMPDNRADELHFILHRRGNYLESFHRTNKGHLSFRLRSEKYEKHETFKFFVAISDDDSSGVQTHFTAASDNLGHVGIHIAALYGKKKIVEKFLHDRSFDVNTRTNSQETSLISASYRGHVELVEFLIEKGAMIDARNKFQQTSLHYASYLGHVQVVKLLIDNGAMIDARVDDQETSLHWASSGGHVEVVKLLIEKRAMIDARNKRKMTSLHCASGKGHVEVVKLLIDNDAMIDAQDEHQQTSLYRASRKGHVKVVKLLIKKGAMIDTRDDDQQTSLYRASLGGHDEVVWFLRTLRQETSLCRASLGRHDVVKFLIENGAMSDARHKRQMTSLIHFGGVHFGGVTRNDKVVNLLIEAGAMMHAEDELQQTSLHHASLGRHDEVVRLFRNSNQQTSLHHASLGGHDEVVKFLIENDAMINARNVHQETSLILASYRGHVELVKFLIEKGAMIDARNKLQWTSLHLASYKGHVEVVKLLIENDAMIDARNKFQQTSLHRASLEGHAEVVKFLIENGAMIHARDDNQLTSLYHASYLGHVEVVKLLIEKGAMTVDAPNEL